MLAQQAADPEDIDDLEEYEETRKRRGGFEMVDVGTLLMPKGFEEEDLEVISTALVQSPLIDEVKVSVQVDKSIEKARETVRKPLAPPRTAYGKPSLVPLSFAHDFTLARKSLQI